MAIEFIPKSTVLADKYLFKMEIARLHDANDVIEAVAHITPKFAIHLIRLDGCGASATKYPFFRLEQLESMRSGYPGQTYRIVNVGIDEGGNLTLADSDTGLCAVVSQRDARASSPHLLRAPADEIGAIILDEVSVYLDKINSVLNGCLSRVSIASTSGCSAQSTLLYTNDPWKAYVAISSGLDFVDPEFDRALNEFLSDNLPKPNKVNP